MWMDTKYEPGTVKVVAYDENGKAVAEKEMHTAGKPYAIELIPDRTQIKADGKDLSFVTVRVVDKDGNLCPTADNEIKFKVKGKGCGVLPTSANEGVQRHDDRHCLVYRRARQDYAGSHR